MSLKQYRRLLARVSINCFISLLFITILCINIIGRRGRKPKEERDEDGDGKDFMLTLDEDGVPIDEYPSDDEDDDAVIAAMLLGEGESRTKSLGSLGSNM